MAKDFRVKVGVRNNALLECIERRGYTMGPTFCKQVGISYQQVMQLVAMRESPVSNGDWRPIVHRLSAVLDASPEEMFHTAHVEPLAKNNVERKADQQEVFDLLNAPDDYDPVTMLEHNELGQVMDTMMEELTPREREIVERTVMADEMVDDVAKSFGITRSRVAQVRDMALRKLRHPTRYLPIKAASDLTMTKIEQQELAKIQAAK